MDSYRRHITEALVALGEKLACFGSDTLSGEVIRRASQANPWFLPEDIVSAVEALRDQMLDRDKLTRWLSGYPENHTAKDVAVIMAGNIPLVGFFDMLCVLASGHRCVAKFSSKDTVLMEYVAGLLRDIDGSVGILSYNGQPVDAAIATGSDNTNRYFRTLFAGIPALLRGNRASVAVLTGTETERQIEGLAKDMFSYSGLGCRNVSRLFVPRGYDLAPLAAGLGGYAPVNPKYRSNFRQRAAVLKMNGADAVYGSFFVLCNSPSFPAGVSEVTYSVYDDIAEVGRWLEANDNELQCVVHDASSSGLVYPRSAGFGESQSPSLNDYPDGCDVMAFLAGI